MQFIMDKSHVRSLYDSKPRNKQAKASTGKDKHKKQTNIQLNMCSKGVVQRAYEVFGMDGFIAALKLS